MPLNAIIKMYYNKKFIIRELPHIIATKPRFVKLFKEFSQTLKDYETSLDQSKALQYIEPHRQ